MREKEISLSAEEKRVINRWLCSLAEECILDDTDTCTIEHVTDAGTMKLRITFDFSQMFDEIDEEEVSS